ncbi:hypothetical protein MMC18_004136 [Xylographa bjoerkii]|nr:hypothetical protein [Xylographa bjoerkii]
MLDPFLAPIPILSALSAPVARILHLTTLPLHIHEVLIAFTFYNLVNSYGSPYISTRLFPREYGSLSAKTRLNWDVHVVSFVQSCIINFLALWVMWRDEERRSMDWRGRVYGYTGGDGMIQGFAAGYFLWDLCISVMHVDVFGWGMLAHAVSALVVFSLGFVGGLVTLCLDPPHARIPLVTQSFALLSQIHALWLTSLPEQRPFVNFYAPTFILYELSSPFLNIHWFCDKLHLTGSRVQLYNGLVLLATFFSCRLVWGTYQSLRVYQDVWAAIQTPGVLPILTNSTTTAASADPHSGILRFQGDGVIPVWLACTYLGSNIVLNTLNFYWFGKMIEAVKKRFRPVQREKEGVQTEESAKVMMNGSAHTVVNVEKTEVRRRKG